MKSGPIHGVRSVIDAYDHMYMQQQSSLIAPVTSDTDIPDIPYFGSSEPDEEDEPEEEKTPKKQIKKAAKVSPMEGTKRITVDIVKPNVAIATTPKSKYKEEIDVSRIVPGSGCCIRLSAAA